MYEYVAKDSLPISACPSSDLCLFASRYEGHHFPDCISWETWKSRSCGLLSVPERHRTEHGAKPMCMDTPRVHANLIYDLTEVRLPPVEHGRQRCAFPCIERSDRLRQIFELWNRKLHGLHFSPHLFRPNAASHLCPKVTQHCEGTKVALESKRLLKTPALGVRCTGLYGHFSRSVITLFSSKSINRPISFSGSYLRLVLNHPVMRKPLFGTCL